VKRVLKRTFDWFKLPLAAFGLFYVIIVATPLNDLLSVPLRVKAELQSVEAIMVLGAGASRNETLTIPSLTRAIHAYSLYKAGYAPRIILSGGRATPRLGTEDLAMKRFLLEIGGNPKKLETETRSTRTYANALESARILQPQGVTQILLVSHPNHMRCAKWTFEKAGFTVFPAPIPWERPSFDSIKISPNRICRLWDVLVRTEA